MAPPSVFFANQDVTINYDDLSKRTLIYFIPGNPGLIDFYARFLQRLSYELFVAAGPRIHDVYGRSLPGFSEDTVPEGEDMHGRKLPGSGRRTTRDGGDERLRRREPGTWRLEEVIQDVERDVRRVGEGYEEVVIMGHSVGTYIGVEVFDRIRRAKAEGESGGGGPNSINVARGVLLFPTLTDIAKSPNGVIYTKAMKWLPFLPKYGYMLARALLALIPSAALVWFITNVMGFTPATAEVARGWLKSWMGVKQTLTLACDEMEVIGEEKWEEEIWEGSRKSGQKWSLLYGEEDAWVGEVGRGEFLKRRRQEGERKVKGEGTGGVMVKVEALDHAFGTRKGQDARVAEIVKGWILEGEE